MFSGLRHIVLCDYHCDHTTAGLVIAYLSRGKRLKPTVPLYQSAFHFRVRSLGRVSRVVFRNGVYSGTVLLWKGKRPIWYRFDDTAKNGNDDECMFTHVRGMVNWEALLREATEWERYEKTQAAAQSTQNRHCVHYHHGKSLASEMAAVQQEGKGKSKSPKSERDHYAWNRFVGDELLEFRPEDIGPPEPVSVDGLALMPEIQTTVDEIRFWYRQRSWYSSHKMPWRRGFLFHGAPGTGKTTLAREMAAELDLPVHVMDLASMSNEDLREAWGEALADSPCMVLLEDVDGVFDGRTNKTGAGLGSGGLTFDCLLNCVDGVERADGVLLVVTTNFPDSLDEALTRPGRIDSQVEFKALDFARRLALAKIIMGECPEAAALANGSGDVSAAKFSEMCCREALKKLYDQEAKKEGPYR